MLDAIPALVDPVDVTWVAFWSLLMSCIASLPPSWNASRIDPPWRRSAMSKAPILSVRGLTRTYPTAQGGLTVLKGVDLDVFPGELVGADRPFGFRQVVAAARRRSAGKADQRHGGHRRRTGRRPGRTRPHAPAPWPDRLRLSVSPSAARVRRPRQRRLADADRRPGAGRGPKARRGHPDGAGPGRTADAPAGPAIGGRAAARRHRPRPGQWSRACCWPTSRPATWTRPPASRCSNPCATLAKTTGVAALIATHNMELAGHMDRVFALRDGHLEERAAESHAY